MQWLRRTCAVDRKVTGFNPYSALTTTRKAPGNSGPGRSECVTIVIIYRATGVSGGLLLPLTLD